MISRLFRTRHIQFKVIFLPYFSEKILLNQIADSFLLMCNVSIKPEKLIHSKFEILINTYEYIGILEEPPPK